MEDYEGTLYMRSGSIHYKIEEAITIIEEEITLPPSPEAIKVESSDDEDDIVEIPYSPKCLEVKNEIKIEDEKGAIALSPHQDKTEPKASEQDSFRILDSVMSPEDIQRILDHVNKVIKGESTEDTSGVPAGTVTDVPTKDGVKMPEEDTVKMNSESVENLTSENTVQMPNENIVQNTRNGDTEISDETLVMPSEVIVEIPSEGILKFSSEDIVEVPNEGIVEMPNEGIVEMPFEGFMEMPIESVVEMPIEGMVEMPSVGIVEIPSEGLLEMSSEGIVEMPNESIIEISGEVTEELSSEVVAEVSSESIVQMASDGIVNMTCENNIGTLTEKNVELTASSFNPECTTSESTIVESQNIEEPCNPKEGEHNLGDSICIPAVDQVQGGNISLQEALRKVPAATSEKLIKQNQSTLAEARKLGNVEIHIHVHVSSNSIDVINEAVRSTLSAVSTASQIEREIRVDNPDESGIHIHVLKDKDSSEVCSETPKGSIPEFKECKDKIKEPDKEAEEANKKTTDEIISKSSPSKIQTDSEILKKLSSNSDVTLPSDKEFHPVTLTRSLSSETLFNFDCEQQVPNTEKMRSVSETDATDLHMETNTAIVPARVSRSLSTETILNLECEQHNSDIANLESVSEIEVDSVIASGETSSKIESNTVSKCESVPKAQVKEHSSKLDSPVISKCETVPKIQVKDRSSKITAVVSKGESAPKIQVKDHSSKRESSVSKSELAAKIQVKERSSKIESLIISKSDSVPKIQAKEHLPKTQPLIVSKYDVPKTQVKERSSKVDTIVVSKHDVPKTHVKEPLVIPGSSVEHKKQGRLQPTKLFPTCEICGKAFDKQKNLEKHLFKHTAEKPNTCEICNKVFRKSKSLRKHTLKHTTCKSQTEELKTKKSSMKDSYTKLKDKDAAKKKRIMHIQCNNVDKSIVLPIDSFGKNGNLDSTSGIASVMCTKCNKPVSEKSSTTKDGKAVCAECAKNYQKGLSSNCCAKCSKPVVEKGSNTKDGKIVCSNCDKGLQSSLVTYCTKCNKQVSEKGSSSKDSKIVCSNCDKGSPKYFNSNSCTKCHRPVLGKDSSTKDGKTVCSNCEITLTKDSLMKTPIKSGLDSQSVSTVARGSKFSPANSSETELSPGSQTKRFLKEVEDIIKTIKTTKNNMEKQAQKRTKFPDEFLMEVRRSPRVKVPEGVVENEKHCNAFVASRCCRRCGKRYLAVGSTVKDSHWLCTKCKITLPKENVSDLRCVKKTVTFAPDSLLKSEDSEKCISLESRLALSPTVSCINLGDLRPAKTHLLKGNLSSFNVKRKRCHIKNVPTEVGKKSSSREKVHDKLRRSPRKRALSNASLKPVDNQLEWEDIGPSSSNTKVNGESRKRVADSNGSVGDNLGEQNAVVNKKRKYVRKRAPNLVPNADGQYECDICEKAFDTARNVVLHKRNHQKPVTCPTCGQQFKMKHGLDKHIRRTHEYTPSFVCGFCKKGFYYKVSFLSHISRLHGSEKIYTCDICDIGYPNESDLQQHKETHIEKEYPCNRCGKVFNFFRLLRKHQMEHTVKQCTRCSKTFATTEQLKEHGATHNGFKCDVCGKTFPRSSQLKDHLRRIHTREKPYKCSFCESTFISNGEMHRHMRIHDERRGPSCKTCRRTFSRMDSLKRHQLECTVIPNCSICNKRFSRMDALKRHQITCTVSSDDSQN